jgi:microcystin-dependent protein
MAYTIKKTDLSVLTTIADGTKDTTTSLTLAGPNFVGYGQELNENLIYLLENFAGNSAPSATNLQGQLWFDKYNQILKVFTDQGYVPVNGVTNSGSQPSQSKNGDIWFNTSTEQLYIYDTANSAGFKLVGPAYTRQQGISGAVPTTVEDGSISNTYHNIIKLQFGNLVYATLSADTAFLPTPAIPGFTFINPGITFSSNVLGPTINANVTGTVTGALIGSVTGNVTATTLSGTLTGNVVGNLNGNVVATTLTGNLTGNSITTNSRATNFSSGNAVITGGYIQNLANVSATAGTIGTLSATTAQATNFISSNISVTGGSATGLVNFSVTNGQAVNFSTSNILAIGGSAISLTNFSTTNGQALNFSTGNALITGGTVYGVGSLSAATVQATNLSSANVLVTGGSATSLITLSATTAQATNLSSSNVLVTGGTVSGVSGSNNTFTSANLINSVATTRSINDSSTAIATTAFVHSVLPQGVIMMWAGSAGSVPTGWWLCDGSNGTPDLRGQFIVGAGGAYNPGDTGGSEGVTLNANTLPIHSHTLSGSFTSNTAGSHTHTITDPGHTHPYRTPGTLAAGGAPGVGGVNADSTTFTTQSAVTGISIASALDHVHSVTLSGTTGTTGGYSGTTQPHENRPPYYALCYIQKRY